MIMKAKTEINKGIYVFFAYETYDGWDKFGSYNDAVSFNLDENNKPLPLYLCGYLVNEYYGSCEKILELELKGKRPTISKVKEFMRSCYKCLEQ